MLTEVRTSRLLLTIWEKSFGVTTTIRSAIAGHSSIFFGGVIVNPFVAVNNSQPRLSSLSQFMLVTTVSSVGTAFCGSVTLSWPQASRTLSTVLTQTGPAMEWTGKNRMWASPILTVPAWFTLPDGDVSVAVPNV